jgi:hypothetical protein
MFTFRNILAVGVFLFGTTFLWMTPAFLPKGGSATGAIWIVIQVLALAAIIGFTIAAWGIFKDKGWLEPAAIGSAIVGIVAVIAYWIGANDLGAADSWSNIALHFLGSTVIIAALLVSPFEHWIAGRL